VVPLVSEPGPFRACHPTPTSRTEIAPLVVQIARENARWGYDRIQGALAKLGPNISDQTVGNVLKAHRIEPVSERKRQSTWKTFLKSHWDVLGAIDFTTVEVWCKGGLVTFYLLFVMEIATRRVQFAGCTPVRWLAPEQGGDVASQRRPPEGSD
jgi:putative transposase